MVEGSDSGDSEKERGGELHPWQENTLFYELPSTVPSFHQRMTHRDQIPQLLTSLRCLRLQLESAEPKG